LQVRGDATQKKLQENLPLALACDNLNYVHYTQQAAELRANAREGMLLDNLIVREE
jgi:hypothetical protein